MNEAEAQVVVDVPLLSGMYVPTGIHHPPDKITKQRNKVQTSLSFPFGNCCAYRFERKFISTSHVCDVGRVG